MHATRARVLLVSILVLAAVLRLTGIGSGLRHLPDLDERWFVENVGLMLAAGDLDHRFYEYPGLFFYILAPVLAFLHAPHFGAGAYLAARVVVALFGVASVGLTYLLGARLAGRGAGLAAALFVAVSPVEVYTAHRVRPDVALEAFVLLAFLAFLRLGPDSRGDILAGVALGVATALKFTGVLLAPSYLAQRLGAPGFRLSRLALAAGAALVAFTLCSPFTILHFGDAVRGAHTQVSHHYVVRGQPESYLGMAWTYGLGLMRSFGPLGLALVAAGALLAARDGRRWLGLLVYPLVVIGVLSTAEIHFVRHLVPLLGVLSVLAGRAVASLANRSPVAAVCATVAAAALPLAASIDYVRGVSVPGTRDTVLEWVDQNLPAGSHLVSSVSDLGLDPHRYEIVEVPRLDERTRPLVLHADAVISGPGDSEPLVRQLATLFAADPPNPHAGPRLVVSAPRRADRPAYDELRPSPQWLSASEAQGRLTALVDGDRETAWMTSGAQSPGTWIRVDLPTPRTIGGLQLRLRRRGRTFGKNLHVFATEDGREWSRVDVLQGRPPVTAQLPSPEGPAQVLIFEPRRVSALRIEQVGRRERPWGVAELRLFALPERQ
jgi:dolichyl-phosphate-mannose-protein mannosyltransferase/F5/8 type C domain-containing protein